MVNLQYDGSSSGNIFFLQVLSLLFTGLGFFIPHFVNKWKDQHNDEKQQQWTGLTINLCSQSQT